ncbi:hypothetical protein [Nocardia rhizosphaerihabitans]|uniref:Secreted protein n=1 Tax=Nocardia rhizosphaerihabitans TaxID=1691570 RepID=A0ABQ2KMG4_9NOCA|nr:hypothetical protein [Nocardia rhizosphaerihabitans]GGN87798.1 hypothetical protein GCM10011610_44460 [Nocardia rhizosphaerihabitans]
MTQWLPLLGSLVVAAAVLVGVIANNRTHRDGIAAADERGRQALDAAQRNVELSNMVGDQRDHEAWRREAVLAAVASILETSASVRADLTSCGEWDLVTAEEIDNVGAQIHKVIWDRPNGMLTRLRVVAHRRIPNKCEDLLRTLTAAQHITMQRLKLHIDVEATVEELEEMASLWQKAMRHAAEQERALVETTRIELGIDIATKGPAVPPVPAPAPPVAEPVVEPVAELVDETPVEEAAFEPEAEEQTAELRVTEVAEDEVEALQAEPAKV